jgi:streptogramin lyase
VPRPEIVPLTALGASRIDVRPHPDWIVVAGDRVWVAGVSPGVAVFRPGTGERVGSVAIEGELCGAPDVAFGSVWFPTCGPSSVVRVSVASQEVTARIPLELPPEGEFTIGAGEGGVWAVLEPAGGSGRLARIDPASDRVAEVLEVAPGAWSVRAGHGWLWVACPTEDRVLRIDPADGRVTAEVATGGGPRFLVASASGVWVLNQSSGTLTHLDPGSGRAVATVEVDGGPMKGGDVAIGLGSIWVRGTTELIDRIDPVRHELVARIGEPTIGSASVAAVGGEVWASAGAEGWLFRIPVD